MKRVLLLLPFLNGCDDVYYNHQDIAAIEFYKHNIEVIKNLTNNEEILGWVYNCDGKYTYSDYMIGSTKNIVKYIDKFGCSRVGIVHSHPLPDNDKLTRDLFSAADFKTSYSYTMYLIAKENCYIRKSNSGRNVYLTSLESC